MEPSKFYKTATANTTINFDESPSPNELGGGTPNGNSPAKRKFVHNYPTARDGHAAVIYFGCLWIFGGDRHHMPFNDLQILPLAAFTKNKLRDSKDD